MNRRAQTGAAASLVILIGIFFLLYLLLIPPDEREALLNDGTSTTGKSPHDEQPAASFEKTALDVTPGRVDFLKFKEYEHPLPAVNLFSTTSSEDKNIGDSVYVKNGIFDKKTANLSFKFDSESVSNVYLAFRVSPNRNNQGRLIIYLNKQQIFNKPVKTVPDPIKLESLGKNNVLSFEVTGVGYRFWTTNEYEVDDIKLFYDVTDTSNQESKNTFMVTDSEKFNLDKVSMKFFPDCDPRDSGKLSVLVNREMVFSSVPDCGQLNKIELSPSVIEAGMNRVEFRADGGKYLIDQILVETDLKSMTYPTYYFDLEKTLFSQVVDEENDEECGDVDGICPDDCDADLDKDCCFERTSNYWCDYQPSNQDNRCRAVRSVEICSLCPSGYEDSDGDPPEECEDLCGDDTDNDCLSGCSRFYDKDCCFDDDEDNFWCDDIPKYGLATCKDAITLDECNACPDGWDSDESDFRCTASDDDTDAVLKTRYDVDLTLRFADDIEKKAGRIFINGYQFHFQTYDDEYSRNINRYVEDRTNSIKIEPDQTVLDIRQLVVEIED